MKSVQDLFGKIEEYEFKPFAKGKESDSNVIDYDFEPLITNKIYDISKQENVIKKEREFAEKSGFEIAPIVREHRGINRQEELERHRLFQEEVERQVYKIHKQAYADGFEEGEKNGREEVFDQLRSEVEAKVSNLSEMINEVLKTQAQLIEQEKLAVYRIIKNLTKWILLKELKDDGKYIIRLLEKLISELQVKNNLLIQLDPNSFQAMPDILEMVQEKLGTLENVRVECDYDIEGPGIVVESQNGIINGTLKEQFMAIDRLFENVGLLEDVGFTPFDEFKSRNLNEQEDDDES